MLDFNLKSIGTKWSCPKNIYAAPQELRHAMWNFPRNPLLQKIWHAHCRSQTCASVTKEVYVDKWESLTSLFPASVAKDLVKLEKLEVQDCKELMEVVEEDNANPRGTNLELPLLCPCVRSLELRGLPKFKYFYYCSLQFDILKTYTLLELHTEDQVCIEKVLLFC